MTERVLIDADHLQVLEVYGRAVLKYAPPVGDEERLIQAVEAARAARHAPKEDA